MARSKVLERLLKSITPEKVEKMKQDRLEEKSKLTAEWQFGYYVGEDIVNRYLPSMSAETGTRTTIDVSEEDTIEYSKLEKEWSNKYNKCKDDATNEWDEFQKYREILKKKYLPNPLKCHMSILNITDLDEFKKGLIWSLWDSDHCNYNLETEKIKIYDDESIYFTIIEFQLD